MTTRQSSRFDAQNVERLATLNETGRMEIQLRDAEGTAHVVSLPLAAAIDLGCLICDVAESTPFLQRRKRRSNV